MLFKTSLKNSLVFPSGPGAFLEMKSSMICLNSSWVKSLSSVVSIGCSISLQMFMWRSVSSFAFSPGMSCSIINISVSVMFAAFEPSGFVALLAVPHFLFSLRRVCTPHSMWCPGCYVAVLFQWVYFLFPNRRFVYISLRCTGFIPFSLEFLLFSIRCYLLSAFVLFITFLRSSVQQGTDHSFAVVVGEFRCLNISLHVDCVVSSNFSKSRAMSFWTLNFVFHSPLIL